MRLLYINKTQSDYGWTLKATSLLEEILTIFPSTTNLLLTRTTQTMQRKSTLDCQETSMGHGILSKSPSVAKPMFSSARCQLHLSCVLPRVVVENRGDHSSRSTWKTMTLAKYLSLFLKSNYWLFKNWEPKACFCFHLFVYLSVLLFLITLCDLQDLISLTRGWTQALGSESVEY